MDTVVSLLIGLSGAAIGALGAIVAASKALKGHLRVTEFERQEAHLAGLTATARELRMNAAIARQPQLAHVWLPFQSVALDQMLASRFDPSKGSETPDPIQNSRVLIAQYNTLVAVRNSPSSSMATGQLDVVTTHLQQLAQQAQDRFEKAADTLDEECSYLRMRRNAVDREEEGRIARWPTWKRWAYRLRRFVTD